MSYSNYPHSLTADFIETAFTREYVYETETGMLEVSGTGNLRIVNTGGSSASEGGMGSGNDEEKEKGEIDTESSKKEKDEADTTFDPIKRNVREKEREAEKD